MVKNPPAMGETWVWSLGWDDPLEEGISNPRQCSCLENPHGQRSLAGCSPWGLKEPDMTEWLSLAGQWLCIPRGSGGKESTHHCKRHRRWEFNPWVRKIPWSRKWKPTPVLLPRKFHGQRTLTGYSPKTQKESDTTEHNTSQDGDKSLWLQLQTNKQKILTEFNWI